MFLDKRYIHIQGCKNDHSEENPIAPYCPAGSPDCDPERHECSAASGSVLLKRIIVKTTSCENCDPSDEVIMIVIMIMLIMI